MEKKQEESNGSVDQDGSVDLDSINLSDDNLSNASIILISRQNSSETSVSLISNKSV